MFLIKLFKNKKLVERMVIFNASRFTYIIHKVSFFFSNPSKPKKIKMETISVICYLEI